MEQWPLGFKLNLDNGDNRSPQVYVDFLHLFYRTNTDVKLNKGPNLWESYLSFFGQLAETTTWIIRTATWKC